MSGVEGRKRAMPISVFAGHFYEFHRERNVARPGAEPFLVPGIEIGPEISREDALRRVGGAKEKGGQDVYTLMKSDAYRLAVDVAGAHVFEERTGRTTSELHEAREPTLSGRADVYYEHYHPGGVHPSDGTGPGHVFFGPRGGS
jgi:hypothetical protein